MNKNYSAILKLTDQLSVLMKDIDMCYIRAQGAGGQNVNKVSSAVHLRFDIKASSLPLSYKEKLLSFKDHHLSDDGVIIIKAQGFRSQEKNREDALLRLMVLIRKAMYRAKKRKPTKPSKASLRRKMNNKIKNSQQKFLRRKVGY